MRRYDILSALLLRTLINQFGREPYSAAEDVERGKLTVVLSGITASAPPLSGALSARHLVLSSVFCSSRGDHGQFLQVSASDLEERGRSAML